jgi:nucleotide-binding universal stress UspA family protein
MFEKILVTLDGSENAEMVLPYTEELAGKYDSLVELVGVVENIPAAGHPSAYANSKDALNSYLNVIAERIREDGKKYGITDYKHIKSELLTGSIAVTILSRAREIDADLIALTARGSSSYDKWPLGNIAAKILRAAKKPVLLVRRNAPEDYLKEKRLIRKILLPLDGSKLGETAVPYVESLAQKISAEVVLLHVTQSFKTRRLYDEPYTDQLMLEDYKNMMHERAYLDRTGTAIKENTGAEVSTAIMEGEPAQKIAEYAEDNNIDLIALSTHGRTGIAHWVFGSVTDKTLHFGETAVLVVRPQFKK